MNAIHPATNAAKLDQMMAAYHAANQRIAPQNANTVDSALVTQHLVESTTTILQNKLAPLKAFTKRFSPDPLKPRAVCQIPNVTAGGTAQTNATNFEDSTNFVATKAAVSCTPVQITSGGHCTNAELQSGHTPGSWLEIKLGEFSDAVLDVVFALLTTGNYGTPLVSSAAPAFSQGDLKTLWNGISKATTKTCILDGDFYSNFLPTTLQDFSPLTVGMPGWDNFLPNTRWAAAGANIAGFACAPSAIAIVAGVPLVDNSAHNMAKIGEILLPDLGLTVQTTRWYSNITRAGWLTFDAVIGAAVLDSTALKLVKRL